MKRKSLSIFSCRSYSGSAGSKPYGLSIQSYIISPTSNFRKQSSEAAISFSCCSPNFSNCRFMKRLSLEYQKYWRFKSRTYFQLAFWLFIISYKFSKRISLYSSCRTQLWLYTCFMSQSIFFSFLRRNLFSLTTLSNKIYFSTNFYFCPVIMEISVAIYF